MASRKTLRLTSRGRHAVLAMIDLAQKQTDKPVPLAEISRTGTISLSYMEQLFAGLRRNGLVKSYRGPGGGYVLAMPASDIKISSILESAEDCIAAKRNTKDPDEDLAGNEYALHLWDNLWQAVFVLTDHITLQDVIDKEVDKSPVASKLFDIAC